MMRAFFWLSIVVSFLVTALVFSLNHFGSKHACVVGMTVGLAGIGGVLGALAGLGVRHLGHRDIDPQDWADRFLGFGIVIGLLVSNLFPALH